MALSAPILLSFSSKQMWDYPLAKPTTIWLMAGLQHIPLIELSPIASDFTFLSVVVLQKWRQLSLSSIPCPTDVPTSRYFWSGLKQSLLPGNLLGRPRSCMIGLLIFLMSHTFMVPSVLLVASLTLSSKETMEEKSSRSSWASLTMNSGRCRFCLVLKICSDPSRQPLNSHFPSREYVTPEMPTYAPRASLHLISVLWASSFSMPSSFCSMSQSLMLPSAEAVTNSLWLIGWNCPSWTVLVCPLVRFKSLTYMYPLTVSKFLAPSLSRKVICLLPLMTIRCVPVVLKLRLRMALPVNGSIILKLFMFLFMPWKSQSLTWQSSPPVAILWPFGSMAMQETALLWPLSVAIDSTGTPISYQLVSTSQLSSSTNLRSLRTCGFSYTSMWLSSSSLLSTNSTRLGPIILLQINYYTRFLIQQQHLLAYPFPSSHSHFRSFLLPSLIIQQMVSVKVTYNAKPKRTETLQVESYADLVSQIYQIFNIQEGKINFMKPRLKDQESFAKDVKENGEILIVGTLKKEKTADELAREKQQEIELQKMREELKMNPHEKIVKRLKEKEVKERGIEYFNTETNQPENLGIEYALCPLYLLKFAHEFKQYCVKYTCMQKNPDGLIIEELGRMFKEMEKGEGVVCPLQWISAWICYCSDDIEYPYPTYGIDYFLNRLFSTMKMAFDVQLEKREEEPNSRVDCGTKFFGLEVLTKRTDLTKLDEQDQQVQKEIDKKVMKYFLECDLGRSQFSALVSGIKQRFKQKNLWRNFYAFDIEYKQKIISIERLPKYLFIHCSRWGYPPAHEEWEEVEFNQGEKSYHQVRINRILDLYDLCDTNLKDKLDQGRYERDQMFYPYHMDERFPNFCQTIKHIDQLSEVEIKYHFLDHILFMKDIYHEFWFETIKNSKPTGEYRLVGVVLHRGHYYHRPNQCHKHNCKGDFMTIVYKRGKEWTKYHRAEVEVVDIDEATSPEYWGKEGGWTPMLLMYKEIYMRNIQVEPPNEPRRDRTTRRR